MLLMPVVFLCDHMYSIVIVSLNKHLESLCEGWFYIFIKISPNSPSDLTGNELVIKLCTRDITVLCYAIHMASIYDSVSFCLVYFQADNRCHELYNIATRIVLFFIKSKGKNTNMKRILFLTITAHGSILSDPTAKKYKKIQGKQWENSLWPRDAILQHRTRLTLTQVMACCLMALSHYLNQCLFLINEVLGPSTGSNFTDPATVMYNKLENHTFKISATSPRVNELMIRMTQIH